MLALEAVNTVGFCFSQDIIFTYILTRGGTNL